MTTPTQEQAILAWNNCNEALDALTALRVTYKHGVKIEPFDLDIIGEKLANAKLLLLGKPGITMLNDPMEILVDISG
jgi:hypothetical protein